MIATDRQGRVITFYSYNGGTGRTMAIANIAWILAAAGNRVLVADWDLESPGLHRYYGPFLDPGEFAYRKGVIDLIREFLWAAEKKSERADGWVDDYAHGSYATPLDWRFPDGGRLDILSAGRQNLEYSASIQSLDWDIFYEHLGGGEFLDALRAEMKRQYDYTLIDSRPGVSDVAEICTAQLPDDLVVCFTLSEQSMAGAAQMARLVQQRPGTRDIRVLPVPMRVDEPDSAKGRAGRGAAMARFHGMPSALDATARATYWAEMCIPYKAFYAYEEILATFGDEPGVPASLLTSYELLAHWLTLGAVRALPAIDDQIRRAVAAKFDRM